MTMTTDISDLFPEIISLDQAEEYVNLLVYGDAGVGKTVFAGSAERVLFLAPEDDGTISAKRQGSTAKKFPINTFDDIAGALNRIEDNIDTIKENFDWIAIDSATHMQRLTMRQILDDAVEADPDRDPDIPQMQDWQKYQNMFLRFIQAFNDLPINVIWTALSRSEEDEEGDDFLVPDIQGKGYQMALTVASYMTSYGHLRAEDRPVKVNGEFVTDADGKRKTRTVRTITWHDTGKIRGKDRTDVLAPTTVNLSLADISSLIDGSDTRATLAAKKKEAALAAKKAPAKAAPRKTAAPTKTPVKAPAETESNTDNETKA